MRRRQEEELAGAEERRQRDIAEQEARRVAELEAAETRRRGELQARDEENHARVTDIERRHLTEKTELTEKHRAEYDQALGRAARAEGELAARVQEIEQAYRRLSGLEADLDAARVELGNRDVKIAQQRDRVAELEAKVADYEDQIVRAFQRIRADDKTTEKTRRALAVALALLDERAERAGRADAAAADHRRIVRAQDLGSDRARRGERRTDRMAACAFVRSSCWRWRPSPAASSRARARAGARSWQVTAVDFHGWPAMALRNGHAEVVVVPAIGRVMQPRLCATTPPGRTRSGGTASSGRAWRPTRTAGSTTAATRPGRRRRRTGSGWWGRAGRRPRRSTRRRTRRRSTGFDDRDGVARRSGLRPARATDGSTLLRRAVAVDRHRRTRRSRGRRCASRSGRSRSWCRPIACSRCCPSVRRSRAGIAALLPAPPKDLSVDGRLLGTGARPEGEDDDRHRRRRAAVGRSGPRPADRDDRDVVATGDVWQPTDGAAPRPGGAHAQIYTSPDGAEPYVELELLGPLVDLAPGQRAMMSVRYRLLRRQEADAAAEARRVFATELGRPR